MATAAAVIAQTAMQLGQFIKKLFEAIKNNMQKLKNFMFAKWKQRKKYMQNILQHLDNFRQSLVQHIAYLRESKKFYPLIILVLLILAIFTDLFRYVLMVVAYIVLAIILVAYEVLSLAPFIWVIFLFFFILFEVVPFVVITTLLLALLAFVTLVCLLLAGLDKLLGGRLRFLVLCQNSAGAWYMTPSHQFMNKYSRGALCTRPCMTGYAPNETGGSCLRLPVDAPTYCPQAEVMRVYSGEGRNDLRYDYKDFGTAKSMRYLLKRPHEREEMILKHYLEKIRFLDKCTNPKNPHSMAKYNHVTMNICASLAAMKQNGFQNLNDTDFQKLERVCSQGFCDVRNSYPFCSRLSNVSSIDKSDLIKKIVYAIIAITVFAISIFMVLFYMNEN